MRVVIEYQSEGDATARIVDAHNLRELSLESRSVPLDAAAAALANSALGSLSGVGHAWLVIEQLQAQGRTGTPSWDDSFQAMIAYAAAQGWVDAAGTSVRAHCVWTDARPT